MSGFAEGTPTAEITLGGKSYTMGFTLGAMKRTHQLGVNKVDPTDEVAMTMALPEYVWACLSEEGRKELSVEAIGELMNPNNIKPIADAIGVLFQQSMPKEDASGNG